MSLIIYSSGTAPGNRLQERVRSAFPQKQLELCESRESLCERLQCCFDGTAVVVLVAGSREELHQLLALRDVLCDFRIILILPDRDQESTRKAHALRPRFLTYADGNLDDVTAVLAKMLGRKDAGAA